MSVQLKNITVSYGNTQPPALDNVTLTFLPGEMVGVLGRSGAGKSTLIRCINGLVRPDGGSVVVEGEDISRLPERRLRRVRSRIGMVFQHYGLVQRMTAMTNVLLGTVGQRPAWRNAAGYFDQRERGRALEALRDVELEAFQARRVERLSGGQQQRVAIARALVQQPSVLLGDEPVSSLDPATAREIMDLLARIHKQENLITILNLHDVRLALRYCSRIIGLHQGRIVYDGPAGDVTPEIRSIIYGSPQ